MFERFCIDCPHRDPCLKKGKCFKAEYDSKYDNNNIFSGPAEFSELVEDEKVGLELIIPDESDSEDDLFNPDTP